MSRLTGIAAAQAKLVAAKNCHPQAVQPLIEEALDLLDEVARSTPPPPADPAKASEPEYDRSLIADMLTAYHSGADDLYTIGAIMEQIRLLRAADNADAAKVRTAKASGSAPDGPEADGEVYELPTGERRVQLAKHARDLPVGTKLYATPPASAPEVTEEMVERFCQHYSDITGRDIDRGYTTACLVASLGRNCHE